MDHRIKAALVTLEATANGAMTDSNITNRRQRLSRLAANYEQLRRAIRDAYPIQHEYVPKASPEQIMLDLVRNKGWVDISGGLCTAKCNCAQCQAEAGDYVAKVLRRQLKTASFVRIWQDYNKNSGFRACAPKWAALLAKHEPHMLKKYAYARATTKRTLVFELEARYGAWGA